MTISPFFPFVLIFSLFGKHINSLSPIILPREGRKGMAVTANMLVVLETAQGTVFCLI